MAPRAAAAVGGVGLLVAAGCNLGVPAGTYPVAPEREDANDVAAGDVNGDGALDLVTTSPSGYAVALNDGAGGYEVTITPTPEGAPGSAEAPLGVPGLTVGGVALGDLDGDGHLDLAYGGRGTTGPGSNGEVVVRLGDGAGGFAAEATALPAPGHVFGDPVLADVDGDDDLDVAASSIGLDQWDVPMNYWQNQGDGTFAPRADLVPSGGVQHTDLLVEDLNGDGNVDVVAAAYNEGIGGVGVVLGTGGGAFGEPQLYYREGGDNFSRRLALADVDGDGDVDIAGTDGGRRLFSLLNDGDGAFGDVTASTGPENTSGTSVAAADIDGDGTVDLAYDQAVVLGAGDGTFSESHRVAGGREVVAADLGADTRADLAYVTQNRLVVLLNALT